MIAALASRRSNAYVRRTVGFLAAALTFATAGSAHAEPPTDYCQRVTARAEGDAALMFAPTVHAQLIRFPSAGFADASGLEIGRGFQPRAAMSIGVIDIYRGFGVLDVARADCRRQQSAWTLEQVVAQRAEIGRAAALEQKLAFLRQHAADVRELVRVSEERFAAQTTTLPEVQDIRLHALAFDRRIVDTEREIAVIASRGLAMPREAISEALDAHEKNAVKHEEKVAHVRNLQPWRMSVTAGVAATPAADAFGVAELSYNLGGLFQGSAERRAIEARANELKTARYEMRQQVEAMKRELRANATQNRLQIRAIEAELTRIASNLASLEGTEAPNKHSVVAAMTLQTIELEAEKVFLTTLADAQMAFGADK